MDERRETPASRLTDWADETIAGLDAREDADRSLRQALRGRPSLREETAARMADALRAAALGLGPAACALEAGVSERLLLSWQSRDASFAAAMAAAREMARAHAPAPRAAALNPAALRVLLKAVRGGVLHAEAAAVVGMSGRALYRLRRESPEIAALVAAARRARPKKGGRRGRERYERGYRLVEVDGLAARGALPGPAPAGDASAL
ncbi:hypothetical protein [Streptomyces katsurahamanus]|uniref:hypothetical protein n=1 Tax=Streptomyces katsurahamanus TaxID=2577098 RepID=UPI001886A00F|nr:hypothetical protein [Streptomyces katsurahamanus]